MNKQALLKLHHDQLAIIRAIAFLEAWYNQLEKEIQRIEVSNSTNTGVTTS